MIDSTEILHLALSDFGQSATIDGDTIASGVLFNRASDQADPYMSDTGHDGPSCNVLRADLETLGQWPLDPGSELETNATLYRIIRSDDDNGDVTLYLREAE